MTAINKFRRALAKFLFPQAQYEAGQRWDKRRSYVTGWVRDARFDADAMTRLEIVRKARYFERNSALVNRLADLFEEYTVGPEGLVFVPASSDQDWNRNATAAWNTWARYPDIRSLQCFGTLQSLMARSWFVDGEIFLHKTRGKQRALSQSFPRVELIETHRVETPPSRYGDPNIIDGIQVDDRGRPQVYWVREGDAATSESYRPVMAEDMVHIFEPTRPGMYRGLSMLYPVLNDLHDLDDLQLLEMDAAKDAASTTNIIKTKTGELDFEDLRQERFGISNSTDAVGTSGGSSQDRSAYYDEIFRGRAKVLRHDDDFSQFVSNRPSVATQGYWDFLISKVCCGVGISKLLVMPYSVQGTVSRADLDTNRTFFRSRSAVLASKLTSVWEWEIEFEIGNNIDVSDPPADWKNVKVRPPRSVDVDVGRNSGALIKEYEAGWRTLEEICGELGRDYRDVLRQRGIERKEAREIEKEFGLQEGELIKAVTEALKKAAVAPEKEEATV